MSTKAEALTENFKTLFKSAEELETPEEGRIEGTIPSWLRGSFIRVGPGKFDLKSKSGEEWVNKHWFDGYAILYKFDIESTKPTVKFQKKFLQSSVYQRATEAGKPAVTEFGTRCFPEPKKGFFSRLMSNIMPLEITDNGMGAVYQIGSEIFAGSDNSYFTGVDPCTLATCKKHDCNKIFGINMLSPHPLVDQETGDIYNVGFSIGAGSKFSIVRIPRQTDKKESAEEMLKKSKVISSFQCRYPTAMPFIHSFGLTKRYVILIESPMVTPITSLATCVVSGNCFQKMTQWRGNEVTNRFIIVDKITGKFVTKMTLESNEPFFFWHMINCYEEENNQLVIDVNAYPNPSVVDSMMIENLRQNIITDSEPSQPLRFVVPLPDPENNSKELTTAENVNLVTIKSEATAIRKGTTIVLTPEVLSNEKGMELPSINRKFSGKKYSIFYGGSCFNESVFTNGLGKMTPAKNGQTELWKSTNFEFPGEPYFVPNPSAEEGDEDDGVILSAVTDVRTDKDDYLLILDAKTMKEIARANFKATVPQGLHGTFISAAGEP